MENFGKQPFFWADMAGLGKYHTGGYGRIGVYRVKATGQEAERARGLRYLTLFSSHPMYIIIQYMK